MLLPIRTSNTDPFGRYYTNSVASNWLISELGKDIPELIVDLGAGAGALSYAARKKWSGAEIVTVDIDSETKSIIEILSANHGKGTHRHFLFDALRMDLPEIIGNASESVDVAICNPPFIRPVWRDEFSTILSEAGLDKSYSSISDVTAEVLFLAQNLRLVRNGGLIGMIVPDNIISGRKHFNLRRFIIGNHKVRSIIKLPRDAFVGTSAQAFIMIIEKNGNSDSGVVLQSVSEGRGVKELLIDKASAEINLDFDYNFCKKNRPEKAVDLKDIVLDIKRGRISSSERLNSLRKYFHTTDFPDGDKVDIVFGKEYCAFSQRSDEFFAEVGDILVSRVGRNISKKICLVKKGTAAVTDCVYIIKPMDKYRNMIFSQLSSQSGRKWLLDMSNGVGASQLSKANLLKFPVMIDE